MPDIRNLEEFAEYAHQQVERVQRMQEDLASQYGTAESPRGLVRARTGPGGAIQELRIDPSALRLPPDEVEAEVTAAVNAAQREYAERADAIMAPILNLRPSEQSIDVMEAGMRRLDALADDLDRLARRDTFR
ncbi:YbaB/EbfC family nucleoid-associated protein [Micromonospora sp. NPDC049559]|uniref:YbaB/EbfC family nucleoid-associated protein n=1 Tax=Micromonospora sp. NPDC049559 TaxID=3155923 RepID=UPI00344194C7